MRHVDDCRASIPQPLDHLEQPVRFVGRERRGRLVHDEQLRLAGNRAQHLDLLLVRDTERARQSTWRQLDAGFPDERGEATGRPAMVDDAGSASLDAEIDVLLDGTMRNQRRLLGDDRDPIRERIAR